MADLYKRAPQIKGFYKRWNWSDLETGATAATATYKLAEIQSDLDWCWARGLKLIVMIQDKTFVIVPGNSKDPAEYVVSRTRGCPLVVGGPDCWPSDETLKRVAYQ